MKWTAAALILSVSALAACGGGSSESAGVSSFNPDSAAQTLSAAYSVTVDVQRAGVSTSQISSTETVQAVATVTSSGGIPVEGVLVTFSQSASTLLTFAPTTATALTHADGRASLDIGATSALNPGATTVQAAAQIGTVSKSSSRSIQIAALAAAADVIPASINFVGAVPSATAIVIKNAGGNGRSESAVLTFRVVDVNNSPINGAVLNFKLNANNGGAVITPAQSATSNSNGLVNVTVTSGAKPASIVVVATARNAPLVKTQSDTLIVSNSVAVSGSFEIYTAKYNLNGELSGDSTIITAFVADEFGNPVADGLAVTFQTDYGAVASSTLGGCLTINGKCSVEFRVQEPRGDGIATVRASVLVGPSTTLATQLKINMSGSPRTSYLMIHPDGSAVTSLSLTSSSCKQTFELVLSNGYQRAAAAGTLITIPFQEIGANVTVKTGSPVIDQRIVDFPPTAVTVEVDLTDKSLIPACKVGGNFASSVNYFLVGMKPPGTDLPNQRIFLAYPQ